MPKPPTTTQLKASPRTLVELKATAADPIADVRSERIVDRKPYILEREREMSDKLSQDEWEYQLIFDNAIVGIGCSIGESMVRCSRRFEEILGYEPGELDHTKFRQIFPTEREFLRTNAAMSRHFRKHRVYVDELLMKRKRGDLLWCALSVKKVNAGTQMRRAIWILQDISPRKNAEEALQRTHQRLESLVHERTQEVRQTNEALRQEIARRKRIEEKLRESRRKYRTLFETAPVGMFVTDGDGDVVEVNRAMARMIPKADLISSMRGSKSARITQIHPDGTEMMRPEFADARALHERNTIPQLEAAGGCRHDIAGAATHGAGRRYNQEYPAVRPAASAEHGTGGRSHHHSRHGEVHGTRKPPARSDHHIGAIRGYSSVDAGRVRGQAANGESDQERPGGHGLGRNGTTYTDDRN